MAAEIKQLSFGEVLALRPVRYLWIARLVSIFGDFLALFAVLSDVSFRLKATPAQVTLISVAFLMPFALLGPVAGVFVDRWDAKRTMIWSDLIRAALALGLLFASGLNQIYAILFALSAVSTFFLPAQTIMIRSVTPREGLMAANALMMIHNPWTMAIGDSEAMLTGMPSGLIDQANDDEPQRNSLAGVAIHAYRFLVQIMRCDHFIGVCRLDGILLQQLIQRPLESSTHL